MTIAIDDLTFGERLALARKRRRMDGRTLAGLMATTQATVSNWENDKARPSLEKIERLAEALGVDVVWLAFGRSAQSVAADVLHGELLTGQLGLPTNPSFADELPFWQDERELVAA